MIQTGSQSGSQTDSELSHGPISTLVLGGARSGKSRHALALAEASGRRWLFVATAEALDEEMNQRISKHVQDRDDSWATLETPLKVAEAISNSHTTQDAVLVDCLTLWLSNLMHAGLDVAAETERLIESIQSAQQHVVLVSNEVGMGIVPESALGREFRDEQGRLNQRLAQACDRVDFVAAGLPITLKPQR